MNVDFHTHIFSPAMIARRSDLLAQDPVFASLYRHPQSKMATVEELIDAMDECAVDVSVVCNIGWTNHALCRESNDYLLEAASRFPARILALVTVYPPAGDAAVIELERCIEAGCQGLGEMRPSHHFLKEPYDKPWTDIAGLLTKRGLVWMGHASEPVGHQYRGKGDLTPEAYYPFIQKNPNLKIVLSHWGGGMPFYNLMPAAAEALANVYYDTAASPLLYSPAIFAGVPPIAGAERILFGSDFPLVSPLRILKQIESAALSAAEKSLILGENARSLLGIETAAGRKP